ncbi:hypothetical protein [Bacillus sp. 1P06AnD]|uniref:hypothetical protein n=1 Tax=Bacillus sp. 1P06AnD TaxID=3132208 RepID=UPI00399FF53C
MSTDRKIEKQLERIADAQEKIAGQANQASQNEKYSPLSESEKMERFLKENKSK